MSLRVETNNKETVILFQDIYKHSKLLTTCCDDEQFDEIIPLFEVGCISLQYIIDLLTIHNESYPIPEIEKPIPDGQTPEQLFGIAYDSYFNNITKTELMNLIMAANYMDIQIVLQLCCARVAYNIKGRTGNEITEYLNLDS